MLQTHRFLRIDHRRIYFKLRYTAFDKSQSQYINLELLSWHEESFRRNLQFQSLLRRQTNSIDSLLAWFGPWLPACASQLNSTHNFPEKTPIIIRNYPG